MIRPQGCYQLGMQQVVWWPDVLEIRGGAEGLHVWASDASQELLRVVWQPDMREVRQELSCRHALQAQ